MNPTPAHEGEHPLKVVIKLFAGYRDKVGKGQLEWELPQGATVADLAGELVRRHAIIGDPARLVVAVNEEYQGHDYELSDGDEVALIPPVSGG
ncbi:MAG: molybdopterin converting factor subunit 1 [Chloroflexi bacterium]|nr:molybdopterin converting factor subunit 1 [Chloroflexota bacterium]